ncbi:glycerate kinase [Nocardia sp. NPDC052566]|uniref:glycerate kinase n=1 Tax=Nocardia sp. NPDC052566 TaxID=3364330 RepID=UPI0037CC54BA
MPRPQRYSVTDRTTTDRTTPRVLIASDKFKGTLTAAEVGAAVGAGIHRVLPAASVSVVPVADGGDGTVVAALAAGFEAFPVIASGPTGAPVATRYARRGDLAVVELADVSGLTRLPGGRLDPMVATSRGTGEVIAAAVDAGCWQIVLGIGGSAGTDGGAGLLQALGADLLDVAGAPISPGGNALRQLATIDLTALRQRMSGIEITLANDVDNPLTGRRGAAVVYGPQKGADATQVAVLDAALTHWADLLAEATGTDVRDAPGAGAAGGAGFAVLAVLAAHQRPGIDLVLDLIGFADHLADADLVITGEGALDDQTLHGKTVTGIVTAAHTAGIPVVAVCGQNLLSHTELRTAGIAAAYPLTDLDPDLVRCHTDAPGLLERLGERIATDHLRPAEPAPDPSERGDVAGSGVAGG